MAEYQKIGGIWKPVAPSIRIAGTWRPFVKHVKVGGVWKSMSAAAPWALSDLGSNRLMDLDASIAASITGTAPFTNWDDQSSFNRDATSGSPATSAYYDSSIKAIRTTGGTAVANAVIQLPGVGTTTWQAFIVSTRRHPGNNYATLLMDTPGNHQCLTETGNNHVGSYGNSFGWAGSLIWPTDSLHLVRIRSWNGSGTEISLDGGTLTATNRSPTGGASFLGNYQTGGQNWGDIHQAVFVPDSISNADAQRIEGFLTRKWDQILGVTTLVSALPSGHPYKSSAP